ncbi:MAG: hypothetical protein WD646_10300 [Actinomycetota bacterium]
MSLQEFTRSVGKRIGSTGGAYMLHPETGKRGEEAGLDFFGYYALGRGGVLGNVAGDVVAAAFFFFEPELVCGIWNAAREKVDPKECASHYFESCAKWARSRLADVDGLDDFCKSAQRVCEAADVRGLSLFAGWRCMPRVDDAPGRALQLIHVLREFRGGANGIATRALGLTAPEAVATNSPGMFQMFGWQGDPPDAEALRDRVAQAEDLTDEIVGQAFGVLSESEREQFAKVVEDCAKAAGV